MTRFQVRADGQESRRQQTALMVDGQKGRVVMEFKQTPTEPGEDAIAAAGVCIWACKHATARSLNSRFGAGQT